MDACTYVYYAYYWFVLVGRYLAYVRPIRAKTFEEVVSPHPKSVSHKNLKEGEMTQVELYLFLRHS